MQDGMSSGSDAWNGSTIDVSDVTEVACSKFIIQSMKLVMHRGSMILVFARCCVVDAMRQSMALYYLAKAG